MERQAFSVTILLPLLILISCGIAEKANFPEECDGIATSLWTSSSATAKGYHVLCLPDTCSESSESPVPICWNGRSDDCEIIQMKSPQKLVDVEEKLASIRKRSNMRRYLVFKRSLKGKEYPGQFAFFKVADSDGMPTPITSAKDFAGFVLVFEGGNFVWPGIRTGFARNITLQPAGKKDAPLTVQLQTLHPAEPLIFNVKMLGSSKTPHFLSSKDCKVLTKKAKSKIHLSGDISKGNKDIGQTRTSSTMFIRSEGKEMYRLDRFVAALTMTPQEHMENSQFSRYRVNEKFYLHYDFFEDAYFKKVGGIHNPNSSESVRLEGGLNNRLATTIWYLNTPGGGGATNFPRVGDLAVRSDANDAKLVNHQDKCDLGIVVPPEAGKHILFYNVNADGSMDDLAVHMGCAVTKGEKWMINKWVWQRPVDLYEGFRKGGDDDDDE